MSHGNTLLDDKITACLQLAWPNFQLKVDLQLPAKGVIALFGASGSGKTTLLRCLAGLERAQGQVRFKGETWQDATHFIPTYRRPLAYVFQEASLFPHLSVLNNLRYGQKRCQGQARIALDHAIELLGIGHLLARKPDLLSGGERQRVGIARALAVNPEILLMDEPLAALDLQRKQEILPYLERLRDELEIPILYVSHAPDEVARLADYLVLMEQGKVLAAGALTELLARLDLPIRLGEDVGVVLDAEIGAVDSDWHLARVDFAGGSLWTRDHSIAPGKAVRVRVLARDVSLATSKTEHSSIQNTLYGTVDAIVGDTHPGLQLVRVKVSQGAVDNYLIARLTRRSAAALGINVGQAIYAQVKSVALM